MKKNMLLIGICFLLVTLSACTKASETTTDSAKPEVLYKQDNSIDLLVYNGTAYVNASKLDWIDELELKQDKKLGEIERNGITKKFKDFDATLLKVGTEIYSVLDRDDFVLVAVDHTMVPYYAYREG
jgi:hypothetical protein